MLWAALREGVGRKDFVKIVSAWLRARERVC
jgi:hypothetical protein